MENATATLTNEKATVNMLDDVSNKNQDGNRLTIIKTVLHQIDVGSEKCTLINLGGDLTDLNNYLQNLLSDLNKKTERRLYNFQRDSTEFCRALVEFGKKQDLSATECNNLAERLLVQEVNTELQYGNSLGTQKAGGLVQKGSFLQFLYKNDEELAYLGVKLEHQTFVDEQDFKRKSGLPDGSKVYKACHVVFDTDYSPGEAHVYDTNSKPAVYWWRDFLELLVVRDDQVNTSLAIKAVLRVLGQYKEKYPHDHTLLRNKVIGEFKRNGRMNYEEFVRDVVESYSPYNNELTGKIPEIARKLRDLPAKKGFDTQFDLSPDAVDFRRTKIPLTDEIDLAYKSDISNISSKIWAEKTSDGRKLVVIHSESAFDNFELKIRSL